MTVRSGTQTAGRSTITIAPWLLATTLGVALLVGATAGVVVGSQRLSASSGGPTVSAQQAATRATVDAVKIRAEEEGWGAAAAPATTFDAVTFRAEEEGRAP